MWHQELIARLNRELPRWRWKSRLTHRGGTIDGETQKQHIHVKIQYARGHWIINAYGVIGRRQPQYDLTIEDGKISDFDDLAVTIMAECK